MQIYYVSPGRRHLEDERGDFGSATKDLLT